MVEVGTLLSINISGRFSGTEMKKYCQTVLKRVLLDNSVALFFGQQAGFKPDLLDGYSFIGGNKTFLLCDKTQMLPGDEKHYKNYLRDLELQGRLPKHYLPETNYTLCKMRTKSNLDFVAMSWLTDDCYSKHQIINQFKKISEFIDDLSQVEELPLVISGSFRIDSNTARKLVPPGFRVCSYTPCNRRRDIRHSNFFICSRELVLPDLQPVMCGKMDLNNEHIDKRNCKRLFNPEDIFYWDPCIGVLKKKPDLIQQTINILELYVKTQAETPEAVIKYDVSTNPSVETVESKSDCTIPVKSVSLENEPTEKNVNDEKESHHRKTVDTINKDALPLLNQIEQVNNLFRSLVHELKEHFVEIKSNTCERLDNNTMADKQAAALEMIVKSSDKLIKEIDSGYNSK